MTPGGEPFLTTGGFFSIMYVYRTSRRCHIPNIKALGLVVSEKIFKSFPTYSMLKPLTHGAGPFLTPGGDFFSTIYVEDGENL